MDKINCSPKSWQEVQDYAKQTTNKIKTTNFHPDLIIGLSRGGLVPARLFCDYLHIKTCYTIKVDHWGLTATKDGQAKLTHKLNIDLTDKRILIVDDITDTGQSMELAKEHIKELNPKEIKTATLLHIKTSKYKPDFYGEEIDWSWIIFPWNYREDLVNLINKTNKKHHLEIQSELKTNFNLELKHEEILELLEHIEYLNKREQI